MFCQTCRLLWETKYITKWHEVEPVPEVIERERILQGNIHINAIPVKIRIIQNLFWNLDIIKVFWANCTISLLCKSRILNLIIWVNWSPAHPILVRKHCYIHFSLQKKLLHTFLIPLKNGKPYFTSSQRLWRFFNGSGEMRLYILFNNFSFSRSVCK